MEVLLDPAARTGVGWRDGPRQWLREQKLSGGFWVFFSAAFFFDAGFSFYFFLFNLYLLDLRFSDRSIGLVNAALALGSTVGPLAAGMAARRYGLRPLLILCFVTAPTLGILRAGSVSLPAQLALGFLAGLIMCNWAVCYLPALARVTTAENRSTAFSLTWSASIGSSALGAAACGALVRWIAHAHLGSSPAQAKRLLLMASCIVAFAGLAAVLRLHLPPSPQEAVPQRTSRPFALALDSFLLRFVVSSALWSAVLAAFAPFGTVYLSRHLHMPLSHIGLISAVVQASQFLAVLLNPVLFRAIGLANGSLATQLCTGLALGLMAGTHSPALAVPLFLAFSATQWMSTPGLYNLLMNRTPDSERSTAAAMTMFLNALASSGATAGTGILLSAFGYRPVLLGIAAFAVAAAAMCRVLLPPDPA